ESSVVTRHGVVWQKISQCPFEATFDSLRYFGRFGSKPRFRGAVGSTCFLYMFVEGTSGPTSSIRCPFTHILPPPFTKNPYASADAPDGTSSTTEASCQSLVPFTARPFM